MRIYKKILISFITIYLLNSCNKGIKESSETEDLNNLTLEKISALATSDPDNNYVAITCSQVANWLDTVNSYDINASAKFTSDGVAVNTGPIVINGRTINAGPNNLYRYNYKDSNTLAEGKSLLGSSVEVSATGAGTGTQSLFGAATIVVPKTIFPSKFYFPSSTIDKAVALPIKWAPDPNNQYQKVNIEISYYKGISQANQPGMPNSIAHLWYQVADNGSFTVPQADLNVFPKGCYVGISIARASYINSSDDFAYIAVTEGHSTPILVTDSRNPIYADVWSATSTAGIGTLGYYNGDFNGDGNTDIIQPWSNGGTLALMVHDVSGSTPNILCNNTMTGSGATQLGLVPADFDGDGKSDFIQCWKNGNYLGLKAFKSNGTSFSTYGTWTMPVGYGTLKFLPVDIDGDSKTDIAQLWNNNGQLGINVLKSNGTSFSSFFSTTFSQGSGNIGFIPADYDGDGKTDIIQFWNNNNSLGVIVYRSTGSSYYSAWSGTMSEGASNVGFAPVDYNADGKMDFVQGWSNNGKMSVVLYKSNGSSYVNFNNDNTQQGSGNLALLPIKRTGEGKTGFVQVFNNGNKTAFIRYWPTN
jgi:hypothetical protein